MGIPCYVVYTCAEAIEILDREIRSQVLPKGVDKVRSEPSIGGLLLGAGTGKDDNHPNDLSDSEKARTRKESFSRNKTPDRL